MDETEDRIEEILTWLKPEGPFGKFRRLGGQGDEAYLVQDVLGRVSACFFRFPANRKDFDSLSRFG